MTGYSTRDVAEILGVPPRRIREYVSAGVLEPAREGRAYRYGFRDVVLLRTIAELREAGATPRRIRRSLERLKEQLPRGRPLSAVRIATEGGRIVARDRNATWEPDTGQLAIDFEVADLAARAEPFVRGSAKRAEREALDADGWFELGLELESVSPGEAETAYRAALTSDPDHPGAHLNLGRLLHETGEVTAAESHYRRALAADESNATAAFNLGVALEDRGEIGAAIRAYERAVRLDPLHPEGHYNLARLCEGEGRPAQALRHLARYRQLVRPSGPAGG